ncbi:MAG: DUF4382 domain-containing protein [Gammaproteobacteria bacterium]|nr:DUF4382 domain-containing protein [Gammaproteobacteria bacterium]
MHTQSIKFLFLFLSIGALAGCNSSGNGQMTLALTDAPVDNATSVVVDILSVEAVPVSGSPVTLSFSQPQQIDLLQLQQGKTTPLIGNWILPAGQYSSLTLTISANGSGTDSYIVLNDGSQHALVPAVSCSSCGQYTYLTINTPFSISNTTGTTYVVDFDARKSIQPPNGASTAYQLFPLGRMVNSVNAGNIIGVVPNPLITTGCTPAVYVYSGTNATPGDINDSAPATSQPVTESTVQLNNTTGEYEFTAAYLNQGQYTLAFTCQAAQDDPGAANNITFTSSGSAPVIAQNTVKTVLNVGS